MELRWLLVLASVGPVKAFWDTITTTLGSDRSDLRTPRQSFFRWQQTESEYLRSMYWWWDWNDLSYRRRLCVIAGISIDQLPITTAAILNRRMVITAHNCIEPHMNRQHAIRIWTLGRLGLHMTPFRYRTWRVTRIFSKSVNPEHQHGLRGEHVPRHDICVITTLDQMYLYDWYPNRWDYAYHTRMVKKDEELHNLLWTGSGFEYLIHVLENYKIFYARAERSDIVDCSNYLPKWWGKFICLINTYGFTGVQNGGALLRFTNYLYAIGCFEIRYNEVRVLTFTDLRYYRSWISAMVHIAPGTYYEYAYQEWGVRGYAILYDGYANDLINPVFHHKPIHRLR